MFEIDENFANSVKALIQGGDDLGKNSKSKS